MRIPSVLLGCILACVLEASADLHSPFSSAHRSLSLNKRSTRSRLVQRGLGDLLGHTGDLFSGLGDNVGDFLNGVGGDLAGTNDDPTTSLVPASSTTVPSGTSDTSTGPTNPPVGNSTTGIPPGPTDTTDTTTTTTTTSSGGITLLPPITIPPITIPTETTTPPANSTTSGGTEPTPIGNGTSTTPPDNSTTTTTTTSSGGITLLPPITLPPPTSTNGTDGPTGLPNGTTTILDPPAPTNGTTPPINGTLPDPGNNGTLPDPGNNGTLPDPGNNGTLPDPGNNGTLPGNGTVPGNGTEPGNGTVPGNGTTPGDNNTITLPNPGNPNNTDVNNTVSETPTISSQYTFVTETTLDTATTTDVETTPTDTADPDATPGTTLTASLSAASNSKPTSAPLPSGMPARIYPRIGSQPGDPDLVGYTLVSLLLDGGLGWKFINDNERSSSQIFAWFPPLFMSALDLTADQVKTFALQAYVPAQYSGPQDIALLQTMFLAWIPNDSVDQLAQQLKVTSSPFYTKLSSPYSDLARHVVANFPVNAVNPNEEKGDAAQAASGSKKRQDAIIGVVSALGAITLLILAFLVYRAVKQRQALAHRRMSDPPQDFAAFGSRPDGQEFDRDSIGGQRRRSFYYAEDSMRAYEQSAAPAAANVSEDPFNSPANVVAPATMRQRGVAGQMIGTPVLRDNTMNW